MQFGELKGTVCSIIMVSISSHTNTISGRSEVGKRFGGAIDGGFSIALKPSKSP